MVSECGSSQSDAIIRVAAYHRLDFEVALIRSSSRDHASIRSSILEPFTPKASSTIGALHCLPTEVLRIVCLELDVRSCFNLRQVNQRTRDIVSSLYEYRMVVRHALESFRAVLRTGIYRYVSIPDLYKALCTRGCQLCDGEFGGFLFLPSVTRCCYGCIVSSRRLSVTSTAAIIKYAGIGRKKLDARLPVLRTVSGKYSMQQRARKTRTTLVSHQHARDVLTTYGFSAEKITSILSSAGDIPMGRFMVCTPMPSFNPRTLEIQHGVCCKGCQIAVERVLNHRPNDLYRRRDQIYSKEGFLDHFGSCPESVTLWESSKEGTVAVNEPEFTRRRGFLGHLRD